jgi:hypothetical protein
MSLLTSCRSAGDIRCALHHLIDDETLSLIILFDLDVPTTLSCDDRRVKSKLLFIHPEKPEDCGHELQLKTAWMRYPQSVEFPQPHERSAESKAQDEAATVLSGEHFFRISP